uniref:Uncharacterized protein n=1 Tax=Anguilla anguilla TaxID=7936 RepID=A0A0E9Q356_ANGAN
MCLPSSHVKGKIFSTEDLLSPFLILLFRHHSYFPAHGLPCSRTAERDRLMNMLHNQRLLKLHPHWSLFN